uniref:TSA: Wollemia nobilis Ref_Wollemi_Transcript_8996_865 transcribed RNA sequence n=2 Tax=Wollemia nobilis TaxID=56998 RepID=A0A0C9S968_9CONI
MASGGFRLRLACSEQVHWAMLIRPMAMPMPMAVQVKSARSCSFSLRSWKTRHGAPNLQVNVSVRAMSGESQDDNQYKNTVDLPQTSFSLRANSVVREPEIQKLWDEKQILNRILSRNNGENFTLHDGPPYANGDLHIGHALNKILKDFINRYKLLEDYKVHYVPGWDCHGLPIELKVLQSMDREAMKDLTPLKLRKKAAEFAKKTVDRQRKSFKRYGIWGDWDNPYLTLAPEYEAAQIEVLDE